MIETFGRSIVITNPSTFVPSTTANPDDYDSIITHARDSAAMTVQEQSNPELPLKAAMEALQAAIAADRPFEQAEFCLTYALRAKALASEMPVTTYKHTGNWRRAWASARRMDGWQGVLASLNLLQHLDQRGESAAVEECTRQFIAVDHPHLDWNEHREAALALVEKLRSKPIASSLASLFQPGRGKLPTDCAALDEALRLAGSIPDGIACAKAFLQLAGPVARATDDRAVARWLEFFKHGHEAIDSHLIRIAAEIDGLFANDPPTAAPIPLSKIGRRSPKEETLSKESDFIYKISTDTKSAFGKALREISDSGFPARIDDLLSDVSEISDKYRKTEILEQFGPVVAHLTDPLSTIRLEKLLGLIAASARGYSDRLDLLFAIAQSIRRLEGERKMQFLGKVIAAAIPNENDRRADGGVATGVRAASNFQSVLDQIGLAVARADDADASARRDKIAELAGVMIRQKQEKGWHPDSLVSRLASVLLKLEDPGGFDRLKKTLSLACPTGRAHVFYPNALCYLSGALRQSSDYGAAEWLAEELAAVVSEKGSESDADINLRLALKLALARSNPAGAWTHLSGAMDEVTSVEHDNIKVELLRGLGAALLEHDDPKAEAVFTATPNVFGTFWQEISSVSSDLAEDLSELDLNSPTFRARLTAALDYLHPFDAIRVFAPILRRKKGEDGASFRDKLLVKAKQSGEDLRQLLPTLALAEDSHGSARVEECLASAVAAHEAISRDNIVSALWWRLASAGTDDATALLDQLLEDIVSLPRSSEQACTLTQFAFAVAGSAYADIRLDSILDTWRQMDAGIRVKTCERMIEAIGEAKGANAGTRFDKVCADVSSFPAEIIDTLNKRRAADRLAECLAQIDHPRASERVDELLCNLATQVRVRSSDRKRPEMSRGSTVSIEEIRQHRKELEEWEKETGGKDNYAEADFADMLVTLSPLLRRLTDSQVPTRIDELLSTSLALHDPSKRRRAMIALIPCLLADHTANSDERLRRFCASLESDEGEEMLEVVDSAAIQFAAGDRSEAAGLLDSALGAISRRASDLNRSNENGLGGAARKLVALSQAIARARDSRASDRIDAALKIAREFEKPSDRAYAYLEFAGHLQKQGDGRARAVLADATRAIGEIDKTYAFDEEGAFLNVLLRVGYTASESWLVSTVG